MISTPFGCGSRLLIKSCGIVFPNNTGTYDKGVAWNGLTAVTESPSGAEEIKLYADDIKYASLRSAEEYGYTIEAYTYPTEWEPCDGSAQVATGVSIGQQKRQGFGFSWVTTVGNDVDDEVCISFIRPTHNIGFSTLSCSVTPSLSAICSTNRNIISVACSSISVR